MTHQEQAVCHPWLKLIRVYQLHQFLMHPKEFIPCDPFRLVPELGSAPKPCLPKTQDTPSEDKTHLHNRLPVAVGAILCSCSQRSCQSTVGITAPHWPERISGQLLLSQEAQRFGSPIDFPLRINWAVCSEVFSAPCYTHISSCEYSSRLTAAKSYGNVSTGGNPHARS